jgi:alkylhydroperoxidase family enzyme
MPNIENAFTGRPGVFAAWLELNGSIKANMDLRRYELATLAAARVVRSSYCCLAHGRILRDQFGVDAAEALADPAAAGLDDVDRAVMRLAAKVAEDASAIEDRDRQELRDLGLGEEEIQDVVYAAAVRCFFSKTLDALGVQADPEYAELPEALRGPLTVGRPIAAA